MEEIAEDTNDLSSLWNDTAGRATLYSTQGESVSLEGSLKGRPAFLICSGPSLNDLDLGLLDQPGVVTLAVNNAAMMYRRTQYWCSVDDPGNFCDTIWKDARITKFIPLSHLNKKLRVRDGGKFRESAYKTRQMPNLYYFRRHEGFVPSTFLTSASFCWGNRGSQKDSQGLKGGRSVFYVALRLLYYLGARQVFLLGCDFKMNEKKPYAFGQTKHAAGCRTNNDGYKIIDQRLKSAHPYFAAAGYRVWNCTPGSGLTVFPYKRYDECVAEAARECGKKVEVSGWYK